MFKSRTSQPKSRSPRLASAPAPADDADAYWAARFSAPSRVLSSGVRVVTVMSGSAR